MRLHNYVSADVAVTDVKSYDHIHISSADHVFQILIEALRSFPNVGELKEIHFHHSYTEGPAARLSYQEPRTDKVGCPYSRRRN